MFNTRYAQTDPDIDLDKIKSPILQNLIGRYDCILGTEEDQRELYFIDPYKKFFFSVLDRTAWFDLKKPPQNYTGAISVLLPVIRAIYVSRLHRGKGLQETILKDILSICDETGCSIAIYADPFQIRNNGQYNLSYITQALAAFAEFGYEPTDNYELDLVKQRQRFFNVGFKNCVYADATTTEPWQHFMYVPSTAPEPVKMLQNELEVHYDINWAYFNKEGNRAS